VKWLALKLVKLMGWRVVGEMPDHPKMVIIAAPHTSNWDGYWLLVYKVAYGVDVKFFVKKQMFWFPMSLLLNGMGGVPLDRRDSRSAVKQAVTAFNENDDYLFGLAPEGTRSKTQGWKSGFYRIAEEAGVPVVFGYLDYSLKQGGFGPEMIPPGNVSEDMDVIRDFYSDIQAKYPESFGEIRLKEEM